MKKYSDSSQAIIKFGLKILILFIFLLSLRGYFLHQSFLAPKIMTLFSHFPNSFVAVFSETRLWLSDLWRFNNLRKEVRFLREENKQNNKLLLSLKELQEENKLLRAALGIQKETKWKVVPVQIIMFDPSGLSGCFWINKGTSAGLKSGMNVIDKDRNLIGRLTQCYTRYCRGESLFTPNLKIGVRDIRSGTLALIKHDFKGLFYLDLVPPQADIQQEDLLVTSSENELFLSNILVARVIKVPSGQTTTEKKYIVEPLAKKEELFSALVILDFIPSVK